MSTASPNNNSDAIASGTKQAFHRNTDVCGESTINFSWRWQLHLGAVFLGFARTFYLAGIYHTHVPNLLIQVHGAMFSTWILLFAVQTTVVARNNISLHRRLGFFGAGLTVAMVGLGIAAATDSLSRSFAPPGFPLGPLAFDAHPISAIATFAVLIFFSIRLRSNGPAHKRLVLLATLTLIGAAIDRWPFAFIQKSHLMTNFILDLLVLSIVIFDLSTLRRIHRATLLGGLLVAATTHSPPCPSAQRPDGRRSPHLLCTFGME